MEPPMQTIRFMPSPRLLVEYQAQRPGMKEYKVRNECKLLHRQLRVDRWVSIHSRDTTLCRLRNRSTGLRQQRRDGLLVAPWFFHAHKVHVIFVEEKRFLMENLKFGN